MARRTKSYLNFAVLPYEVYLEFCDLQEGQIKMGHIVSDND